MIQYAQEKKARVAAHCHRDPDEQKGITVIAFQTAQLEDRAWVETLLAYSDFQGCEYTFGNLFLWNRLYQTKIARMDDFLLVKFDSGQGTRYLYPAGRGDVKKAIDALQEDAWESNAPLHILGLTEETKAQLEEMLPGQFTYGTDAGGYDYIYQIDRLADLNGKALHNKRNHINRFIEQHPDWRFEPMEPRYAQLCWDIDQDWARASNGDWSDTVSYEAAKQEVGALRRALDHKDDLGLEGGVLFVGGAAVAFTLGGTLNSNTFDVNFEKAYAHIQGAYTMINREFARYIRDKYPDIQYFNREEDLGLPGLRQAKRSYKPDAMVVKYGAARKVAVQEKRMAQASVGKGGDVHVYHPPAACL